MRRKAKAQLTIPTPCQVDLRQMPQLENGVHCTACRKHVRDLTEATDSEILAYLANAGSSACGIFRPDQLQRPMYEEVPSRVSPGWLRMTAALLSGWLTLKSARSEPLTTNRSAPVQMEAAFGPRMGQTRGQVVSAVTGLPIPNARIYLNPKDTGYAVANQEGYFSLRTPNDSTISPPKYITIKADGYFQKQVEVFSVLNGGIVQLNERPKAQQAKSDTITISGWVTDKETGEPISAAGIIFFIDGIRKVARTQDNGEYQIKIGDTLKGAQVLAKAAYIGYKRDSISLILEAEQPRVNFELKGMGYAMAGGIRFDYVTPHQIRVNKIRRSWHRFKLYFK